MRYLTLLVMAYILPSLASSTMEFRATLTHVDSKRNLNKAQLLKLALDRSRKRLKWLTTALNSSPNVEAPTTIKGDVYGEYLMDMSIGNPPAPISLLVSTSSSLTWTQCAPCKRCPAQQTTLFNPTKSRSYLALKCPNEKCKLNNVHVCEKQPSGSKCSYYIRYADDSGSHGYLVTETLWFEANKHSILGVMVGCGFQNFGYLYGGTGTIGLGRHRDSIISQLNVSAFSYCFPPVGSNQTGRLVMGCGPTTTITMASALTTPILNNQRFTNFYYYIDLQGITIGRSHVNFNRSAFVVGHDGLGGMIIDSGVAFTHLERFTFEGVKRELGRRLRFRRTNGSELHPSLELCYEMSREEVKTARFPRFVLQFQGADVELGRRNYFVHDDKGIGCLAMVASDGAVSILGNFQMQNTLVVYDLANQKLSFVPETNCKEM